MNLIMLLLFIPLSFAGAPNCAGLAQILQRYENELENSHLDGCVQINLNTLNPGSPHPQKEIFEKYRCADFKTLESVIQNLENKRATFIGFEKLKNDIREAKDEASRYIPRGGLNFVSLLNTAQSLELMTKTVVNDRPLLNHVQEAPDEVIDLKRFVRELCGQNVSSQEDACNSALFDPSEDAAREIFSLVRNVPSINSEQLSGWQSALSIVKKDDSPYSFVQLQTEMRSAFSVIDTNEETLTKDHLAAIAQLDDFKNPTGDLSFVQDLFGQKGVIRQKALSDRFLLLLGDAKKRQELEIQSKMSITWQNIKKNNPELHSADCEDIKNNFSAARGCLSAIHSAKDNLSSNQALASNLNSHTVPALESSLSHLRALEDSLTNCNSAFRDLKDQAQLPESCFSVTPQNLLEVSEEIRQLNLLKDKIGQQNLDRMKYRNFALQKWQDQRCASDSSPMDLCESWTDSQGHTFGVTISPEVIKASHDSMKILLAFAPPTQDESIVEELCEDEDKKKTSSEEKLCAFFEEESSDYTAPGLEVAPDGPVQAPNGQHGGSEARDAWIQAGGSILGDILRSRMPRMPPPRVNPYPYNFSPFNSGGPPVGIADSIMFNARFQGGYGFYSPTPGVQPGTAFGLGGSSFGGYSPVKNLGSRYFDI